MIYGRVFGIMLITTIAGTVYYLNRVGQIKTLKTSVINQPQNSEFINLGNIFTDIRSFFTHNDNNDDNNYDERLSIKQVYRLAKEITKRNFKNVDPIMLTTMAYIESSNKPKAIRFEPHLNDSSKGLMQVLQTTADWLRTIGYKRYSSENLFDAKTSIYFGGAYVDWLKDYRGQNRDEEWIVRSYNGGPNNFNSQTLNHWNKYQKAKLKIIQEVR